MKNPVIIFSSLYFLLLATLLIEFYFTPNLSLKITIKILLTVVLIIMYFLRVAKQQYDYLYVGSLIFAGIGETFFVVPDAYFNITIYGYLIAHILFTITIYKKYLKNKSFFDAFTFSLPFILTFSVIFVMLEGLDFWWNLKILTFGPIMALNGAIVVLNYANTKNLRNYLFFIGTFMWFVVDTLAAVYVFNFRLEIYYVIIVTLDAIAQYIICRGFTLQKRKAELII